MVGLDIEEAKIFIEKEEIDRKRLEELVGKATGADTMVTINFANNVYEKAVYAVRTMEGVDAPKDEIYKKVDFYCDLLYVIKDQMCNYKYPKDRQDDVGAVITKMRALMDKYKNKQDKPTKQVMQASAPAQSSPSASYTQQATPCKTAKGQGGASKPASSSQPAPSKVWSTKDKHNIDRLLDNFNKRQKK